MKLLRITVDWLAEDSVNMQSVLRAVKQGKRIALDESDRVQIVCLKRHVK